MKAITTEATEGSIPAEDPLRLVIDTTPALIHTGRPDGYLDYFNQRWLEFLGLPLEELCGWRWTGAVHPEDVAGLLQKWHAALGSGEPLEAEARVRRADGEYRLLLHRKVVYAPAKLPENSAHLSNFLTQRTVSVTHRGRRAKKAQPWVCLVWQVVRPGGPRKLSLA
jgi:PAS domain S-box-containing protein